MGGSALDRTNDFQKFCESGLDRIQLLRVWTWLGLNNFTVWSSLIDSGVQDPDFGVQSGQIFGFFGFGLDIVFLSTGSGLSKWNKMWPCKKSWFGI